MKILHVVGARPNYMKTAPIMLAMARCPGEFTQVLVHTGQHYDYNMSKIFFDDLAMPEPDDHLNVGSGTHADQTARTMLAFEPVLHKHKPDWVFVVGDVNSTLACALVSVKLGIPVAHVEAGLRSRDWTMPEEINRLLTDRISSLLFTPSRDGDENLRAEGIEAHKIHFVGNVMIDTLVKMLPRAEQSSALARFNLERRRFVLVTLHRPANVDDPNVLREIVAALYDIGARCPVVFPVHPRTRARAGQLDLIASDARVQWIEPLGYLDFLALMRQSAAVITDSGGVQEETTFLGVPCLTVRPNTERPITIEMGTNQLVRAERDAIGRACDDALMQTRRAARVPEKWDGYAAERIVDVMRSVP
jgi:UDP-N-acetylglucosamine 2-epimerase (non-hydrolysing)